jgi:hypothetical protein
VVHTSRSLRSIKVSGASRSKDSLLQTLEELLSDATMWADALTPAEVLARTQVLVKIRLRPPARNPGAKRVSSP